MFIRIITGALLAVLVLFAGSAYAGSDAFPGGPHDYSAPKPFGYDHGGNSADQFNQYQRQREFDRQAEEYRQESLRQYRSTPPSFGPAGDQSKYVYPEQVITPDGRSMLCTKGGSGTTYCN